MPQRKERKTHLCEYCSKVFKLKHDYLRHLGCHVDMDHNKHHRCQECGKGFYSKESLKTHGRMHSGETPFHCDVCRKNFRYKHSYRLHMFGHTGQRPFSCTVCNKNFAQKNFLTLHMRTHTNERPYKCGQCQKAFHQRSHLRYHLISHTKEKTLVCEFCGKGFAYKQALNLHKRIHEDLRPFSCPVCDRKFRESPKLTIHMRIHSGDRPFKCQICEKGFAQKGNRDKHEVRYHARDPDRKFPCPFCTKSFMWKKCLDSHLQWHVVNWPAEEDSKVGIVLQKDGNDDGSAQVKTEVLDDDAKEGAIISNSSQEDAVQLQVSNVCSISTVATLSLEVRGRGGKTKEVQMVPYNNSKGGSNDVDKTSKDLVKGIYEGKFKNTKKIFKKYEYLDDKKEPFNSLECSHCGKICPNKKVLYHHTRRHTARRKFVCATCDKGFLARAHLEIHVRVHSGDKPYSCGICSKKYVDLYRKEKHEKKFHLMDRFRRFECQVCNKRFKIEKSLDEHLKWHQSYDPEYKEEEEVPQHEIEKPGMNEEEVGNSLPAEIHNTIPVENSDKAQQELNSDALIPSGNAIESSADDGDHEALREKLQESLPLLVEQDEILQKSGYPKKNLEEVIANVLGHLDCKQVKTAAPDAWTPAEFMQNVRLLLRSLLHEQGISDSNDLTPLQMLNTLLA